MPCVTTYPASQPFLERFPDGYPDLYKWAKRARDPKCGRPGPSWTRIVARDNCVEVCEVTWERATDKNGKEYYLRMPGNCIMTFYNNGTVRVENGHWSTNRCLTFLGLVRTRISTGVKRLLPTHCFSRKGGYWRRYGEYLPSVAAKQGIPMRFPFTAKWHGGWELHDIQLETPDPIADHIGYRQLRKRLREMVPLWEGVAALNAAPVPTPVDPGFKYTYYPRKEEAAAQLAIALETGNMAVLPFYAMRPPYQRYMQLPNGQYGYAPRPDGWERQYRMNALRLLWKTLLSYTRINYGVAPGLTES